MLQLENFILELLVNQCMPTLLNAKPSSLVSVKLKDFPDRGDFQETLTQIVETYNCCCYLLNEGDGRLYYIIYQEKLLQECLHVEDNRKFLLSCGYRYDKGDRIVRILEQLTIRYGNYFCKGEKFPHEIGIILGYPIADVEGFIKNEGKNYLLCGMWKVYQDAERASQLFTLFRKMKEDAWRLLQEEKLLDDLYKDTLINLYKIL